MNVDRWHTIEDLFHRASALPPEERAPFLDLEAAGDSALRDEVESLLDAVQDEHDSVRDAIAGSADSFRREREEAASGRRIGDYALVRPLGHGGMGMVYLARRADAEFEKLVAIKFARRAFASGPLLRRFRAERQILARLEHPHIARLLDAGATEDGEPFVVMEYVEGEPIDRFAAAHHLTTEQRLALFLHVCDAVQYAHRNLVVHRDIKPGNILVTAAGEPKLLDFGIAKLLEGEEDDSGETSHTARLLTPEYASPEQRRGERVTTATDVYSLGILLHVLVTGDRPASDGEDAPVRLRGDLRTVIDKARREDPAARYATVQELADDVRRFLDGRPVLARAPTVRYRARKFVRRNAGRVAAAALAIVALIAFAGFYTVRIASERDAALVAQAKAERVSAFMVDLFQYVDPEANRGATITARELLDAAAKQLDTALLDEPDVRATMMYNIGDVYLNIGLREEGVRLIRQAIDVLESRGIPADHDLAAATFRLGNSERDPVLRDSLFRLSIARADSAGESSRDVAVTARIGLAAVLDLTGHRDSAETMLRRELAMLDSVPHPDHDLRSFAEFMLANILYGRGRVLEAEPLVRSSYERRRDSLGRDEPRTLQSLRNYVTALYSAGKWELSADLAKEQMTQLRKVYGDEHAEVALAAAMAARAFRDLGRLAEAESLASVAIENRRKAFAGRDPEETRWSWGDRAEVLATALRVQSRIESDHGEFNQAMRTAREAVAISRQATGDFWSWVAAARADLAEVLYEAGRYADAERELRAMIERDVGFFGDTTVPTAMHRGLLSRVLARTGKIDEADSVLAIAMPVLRRGLPPRHPRTASALVTTAEIGLHRGDLSGAAAAAREALAMMVALAPEYRAWQAEARIPLGIARARAGSVDEGRAIIDSALADSRAMHGDVHATTRTARDALRALR